MNLFLLYNYKLCVKHLGMKIKQTLARPNRRCNHHTCIKVAEYRTQKNMKDFFFLILHSSWHEQKTSSESSPGRSQLEITARNAREKPLHEPQTHFIFSGFFSVRL